MGSKYNRDILYNERKSEVLRTYYSIFLMLVMRKKLYYFSATWCEPCQWAAPVAEELFGRLSEQVDTEKVDVDKQPSLARDMGVLGVPCFILTENGDTLWRRNGFDIADRLMEELAPYL